MSKKEKIKKQKTRDEVLLLHLQKTFKCGFHQNKKKPTRQTLKKQTKEEVNK